MKISEIFTSISGEGLSIGKKTLFIRCFGCNLNCKWCDTPYAKGRGGYTDMSLEEILEKIRPHSHVIITGGEPLLQTEIYPLINELLYNYYCTVEIETNGSVSISSLPDNVMVSMDYKLPSSGMEEKMSKDNFYFLLKDDQVKFVISDDKDYSRAKEVVKSYNLPNVIFTPTYYYQGERYFDDLKKLTKKVMEDDLPSNVRVLPQLHKIVS